MIELERNRFVNGDITLEELRKELAYNYPKVIIGRPPKFLNQTLYDYCEWLRFNPHVSDGENKKANSLESLGESEWFEFWNCYKKEKVYFFDYQNRIAYVDQ